MRTNAVPVAAMDYQDTILCPPSEALALHGQGPMERLIASDPEVHTDWAQLALQEAGDQEPGAFPPREGDDHLGLHIGRYELVRCLGAGGRGTIYLARDPLLQREVALKTVSLTGSLPERRAQAQAFWHEARAVSGLSHPHIVTVFDAGAQDHQCYLVMERLLGKDLRDLLASGWRPEIREALQLGRRIADATLMLQREVALRLAAKPGGGDYGVLAVQAGLTADVRLVLELPPGAFRPPPKVDSAVVRMTPFAEPPEVDAELLEKLVAVAFSQRRKLLRHSLGHWLTERGFSGHFDLQRRAEEVPVQEFVDLALAVQAQTPSTQPG